MKQIPHCQNNSKIPHCQNNSKIPHCQNNSKSNRKIIETGKNYIPNTQIHDL